MFEFFKIAISIIKYRLNFNLKNERIKNSHSKKINQIVSEIKKNGFIVIENYLSKKNCKKIIKKIDQGIKKHPKKIWKDDLASDFRIFGSENLDNEIRKFYKSSFIKKICENYCKYKVQNLMTMANRVIFKIKNAGSGGGWHKDAYYPQFKSIIYLNDVNDYNGPFQLLIGSNKIFNVMRISQKLKKGYPNTRFSKQEIKKLKAYKILTIKAKAGALILVDTSLIHRGKPLKKEKRYAITNYYFPKNYIKKVENKFFPKFN